MKEVAPWIMGPALLLVSGGLLWWQLCGDGPAEASLDEDSQTFFRRQWWRRLQVAVLLGIVGVAMMIGPWITAPLATGIFWLGVLMIVAWIAVLGMIDWWAGRDRLDAEARRIDQERDELIGQLDHEARQLRARRTTPGNGDGK